MIASITGQVEHVGLTTAVVAVGGFGVQVQATPETLSGLRIGGEVRLDTAYVARKDESPLLFGFRSPAEREVFEIMLGVSPNWALAITAAVLMVYVVLGGAHADILTDGVQGLIMVAIAVQ